MLKKIHQFIGKLEGTLSEKVLGNGSGKKWLTYGIFLNHTDIRKHWQKWQMKKEKIEQKGCVLSRMIVTPKEWM